MEENKNQNQNQNFEEMFKEEGVEKELFNLEEEEELEEEESGIAPAEENNREEEGADVFDPEEEFPSLKEAEEPEEPEEREGEVSEEEGPSDSEGVTLSRSKLKLARRLINNIKENNDKLLDLLEELVPAEEEIVVAEEEEGEWEPKEREEGGNKIIEGVFDGESMIGPDGQKYSVPANYASKSKLVEGDMLKLTITPNGGFVYKQIRLVDRKRMVGNLEKSVDGDYVARAKGRIYKLNQASVTYFKGETGDEVVFLVPKGAQSKWGAVENIIKK